MQFELQNVAAHEEALRPLANYYAGNHNAIVMQREWLDFEREPRRCEISRGHYAKLVIIGGNS